MLFREERFKVKANCIAHLVVVDVYGGVIEDGARCLDIFRSLTDFEAKWNGRAMILKYNADINVSLQIKDNWGLVLVPSKGWGSHSDALKEWYSQVVESLNKLI